MQVARAHVPRVPALFLATTMATLTFAHELAAQNAPSRRAYHVTVVQVKPDMGNEWRAFLKDDVNPALRNAGVNDRSVWTTSIFGEAGEYLLVTPVESMKAFDDPERMSKLLGPRAAEIVAKRQRLISSSRSFMITGRPDLGLTPAAGYMPRIGVAVTNSVAPGRLAEYEARARRATALLAKTNVKGALATSVGLGGDPNSYVSMVLFDSWEDIGAFRALYAKAAADAKLGPEPPGLIVRTEWKAYRFAPQLSIMPGQQSAGSK